MTARPVLGEFLAAARRHLEAAAGAAGTSAPGRDAEEMAACLHRLIGVLAGYAADLTTAFGELPDRDLTVLNSYARSAVQAREALSGAAASLGPAEMADRPVSERARRFDDAAVSLLAGRDLLQTHFASGPGGWRRGRSSWAPVITSAPVTRALLADVAAISRQAAEAAELPSSRSGQTAELERRLHLTSQWLALAGGSAQHAYAQEPVSAAERDLLHAIPGSALPPRRVPGDSELVPGLREAVITTSERLSHLAWTAAGVSPGSPAISVTSWRRIASAGTATSHHCHLLLTALAARSAGQRPGEASTIGEALEQASVSARRSRAAWLNAARAFAEVTTDVRWRASRAATEAADLALWTGRLAYASPNWVPGDGPRHPARPPEELAPAPADITEVVAALHYTTEALERLATSSEQQVRGAVRAGRVLIPATSLPDGSATVGQFPSVPKDQAAALLAACRNVTKTSARTASAVAGIAGELRAPSRTLTTAKVAGRPAPLAASLRAAEAALAAAQGQAAPDPAEAPPGPVETGVRGLGVVSPRLLWRASGVDRLASEVLADARASRDRFAPSDTGQVSQVPGAVTPARRVPAAGRGGAGPAWGRARSLQQEPEAEP